ncbi:MAG TPA: PepSY-associated TM helix domain-containing protein, partial [Pseudoxanthomonas sp.]|nr:PepSY-associated TM helix domain-containing protein [Pseudoxanthomonas sp.]
KSPQRSALDLHNLSGVLAMPFHFIIGFSGLVIVFTTYFPSGWQAAYDGDRQAFNTEANSSFTRKKANAPGRLGSIDAMAAEAQRVWGDGQPTSVRVHHPGDANSYVEVRRSYDNSVRRDSQIVYFDGASGAVLARADYKPVKDTQEFIEGLHMIQFKHWTLRWLYFVAGLGGCVMIATGFLVWVEARKVQHTKKGLKGARIVEALAVGSVPGIILSTFAFFIVNRLLPLDATLGGTGRAALEMWTFYLIWMLCFAHAGWRGRAAWAEQIFAAALFAVTAVVLNWITTGDHLLRSLSNGEHAVAGMDTLLLVGAGLAWISARKLRRRQLEPSVVPRRGGTAATEAKGVQHG